MVRKLLTRGNRCLIWKGFKTSVSNCLFSMNAVAGTRTVDGMWMSAAAMINTKFKSIFLNFGTKTINWK
jgi:hypothetical protein